MSATLIVYMVLCFLAGIANADNITKWLNAKPTCRQKINFEYARKHGRV